MVVKIELNECIRDTPLFRKNLIKAESDLDTFDTLFKKINENSLQFYHDGQKYLDSLRRMIDSFEYLKSILSDRDEEFTHKKVKNFCSLLKEARQSEEACLNDVHNLVSDKIRKFFENDMKKIKDMKKLFEKATNEFDTALQKNSDVSKIKPQQCEEMERNVFNCKKIFEKDSSEYIQCLNQFYTIKSTSILDIIQSYSQSMKSFYQCGSILLHEHENEISEISNVKYQKKQKLIEKNDKKKSNKIEIRVDNDTTLSSSNLQNTSTYKDLTGYLFKRTQNNTFKKWTRRWFTLSNSKLYYQKRMDFSEHGVSQMEPDLRLCKVREVIDNDRRFMFEIVSPKCKHLLQADSQKECDNWVQAIDKAIGEALNNIDLNELDNDYELNGDYDILTGADISLPNDNLNITYTLNGNISNKSSKSLKSLGGDNKSLSSCKSGSEINNNYQLMTVKGNQNCCDCGGFDPSWVSINLGAVLCIECSGKHRGLGVHVSKVRSLKLDQLDNETFSLLLSIGNTKVNEIFEKNVPNELDDSDHIEKATPQCDNTTRENWIRAKYAQKQFIRTFDNILLKKTRTEKPDGSIHKSLEIIDFDVDSEMKINDQDKILINNSNSLLHEACTFGDLSLMLYALALNANLNSVTDKIDFFDSVTEQAELNTGYTPLIKSVNSGCTAACELLLLNGAKINSCDFRGRTALHHATILKNLKIVCLLLKRGADPLCGDKNDEDPIQIATENCQANIVTILRVAKMNNDLKEQDMTYSGDPMFSEILNDLLTINDENQAENIDV